MIKSTEGQDRGKGHQRQAYIVIIYYFWEYKQLQILMQGQLFKCAGNKVKITYILAGILNTESFWYLIINEKQAIKIKMVNQNVS